MKDNEEHTDVYLLFKFYYGDQTKDINMYRAFSMDEMRHAYKKSLRE